MIEYKGIKDKVKVYQERYRSSKSVTKALSTAEKTDVNTLYRN